MFESTDKPNPFSDETSAEIWQSDANKLNAIKSKGFNVNVIWESEYHKNKKEITSQIVENIVKLKETL